MWLSLSEDFELTREARNIRCRNRWPWQKYVAVWHRGKFTKCVLIILLSMYNEKRSQPRQLPLATLKGMSHAHHCLRTLIWSIKIQKLKRNQWMQLYKNRWYSKNNRKRVKVNIKKQTLMECLKKALVTQCVLQYCSTYWEINCIKPDKITNKQRWGANSTYMAILNSSKSLAAAVGSLNADFWLR